MKNKTNKLFLFLIIVAVLGIASLLAFNKNFFLLIVFLILVFYTALSFSIIKSLRHKYTTFSKRNSIVILVILFFLLAYILRLIQIQYLERDKYISLMNNQLMSVTKEVGQRGIIFDSNGKKLAFNKRLYTMIIDPELLNDEKIHDNLLRDLKAIEENNIIKMDKDVIETVLDLAKNHKRYKVLAKNIDDEQKEKIDALLEEIHKPEKKNGKKYRTALMFEKSIDSIYYKKNDYEKVIGMVRFTDESSSDKIGISGIEKGYQNYLVERKRAIPKLYGLNKKNTLALSKDVLFSDLNGKNIYLTLDTDLNYILNDEIKAQFEATDAYEAYGMIMDPNTGKILAVSTFSKDKDLLRNNIFQSQYEPGSIFKPLIVASALNEGFINPDTRFDVGDGTIQRFKKTIKESSKSTRGVITTREVVMKSSNVGMVLISDYFTPELFEKYLRAFGLYEKTNVDFPNELKPFTVSHKNWNGLTKNTMSFGQGIVVTPIQMITAFSAVVNGGTLYRPYLVDKITDSDGTVVMRNTPTAVRKILSEKVSEDMRSIMEDTVAKGTGKRAFVEGLSIGGKTGTAQLSGGKSGYIKGEYLSSFIGFFPADKPKYVVMAMYMRPQVEVQANKFGGVVSAPVVGNVIRRIAKEEEELSENIEKINVSKEDTKDYSKSEVESIHLLDNSGDENIRMPNLIGMSPQEVLAIFKDTDFDIELVGTGLVQEQSPKADESLERVKKIKIILK